MYPMLIQQRPLALTALRENLRDALTPDLQTPRRGIFIMLYVDALILILTLFWSDFAWESVVE